MPVADTCKGSEDVETARTEIYCLYNTNSNKFLMLVNIVNNEDTVKEESIIFFEIVL